MTAATDWSDWHRPYADPLSPQSRRLRLVQQHIAEWLDQRPEDSLTVVSACAGQGLDLLGVLAGRADADRVRAWLIEFDQRNVDAAESAVNASALARITVVRADAGDLASYVDAVPADLVLMVGVFGNISDADVRATIEALPQLCAAGATVIWTRTRQAPDLNLAIRDWFAGAGFAEQAYHAPDDVLFSVGVHRFVGRPQPLTLPATLFRFTR